ncbi:MAG TPA: hypothetical protein VNH22_20635, partial [Blastocatellia bacterium]|nr:hypothetical protein [Blastocatellia bacterium]
SSPDDQFFSAGTFGALVEDSQGFYILSNNHVLANENRLPLRSAIFQPGIIDDGNPTTDQIAELENFIFLEPGVFNKVDCAIAKVMDRSQVSNSIIGIGPPRGVGRAFNDMIVHKFGRSTGYRAGRVTSINTDLKLKYKTGSFLFEEQIIIQGLNGNIFADQGDSGSLVLQRETQMAVGLLIGVGRSNTGNAFAVANQISEVLRLFRVRLA